VTTPSFRRSSDKTTELLQHSPALLRRRVCSHDYAVLVHDERSFRFSVPPNCAKLGAHELRKQVWRYARVVRTAVAWLSHECTRVSFERRALCCALIYQHWWAQPLPLIVPYALVVGELCHESVEDEGQGETGSRVKLYGQCRSYRRWLAVPDSTDLRASAPPPSPKASKV